MLLTHEDDGRCLTYAPNVNHGLVAGAYCGRVVQYQNLPFKLPACLWLGVGRYHHHPLPDVGTFDLLEEGSKENNGRSVVDSFTY